MKRESAHGFDTDYAFLYTAVDKCAQHDAKRVARAVGVVDILILVGIGGSNLGTLALAQAIRGSLQHLTTSPALLCADTTDAHALHDIVGTVREAAKRKQRVALVIISKSGTTTETVANANVLLETFPATGKDWRNRVVAITDEGSALWIAAGKERFHRALIPSRLGGRYSVLSAVGLVPLAILGINTSALLTGANAMRARVLAPPHNNPAAQLALAQYTHLKAKRNIVEYFVFGSDLEGVGHWYRQLLGESCGKNGKGITPTVAVGSTDLHSIGQLALGGPHDKFTIFLGAENDGVLAVPKKPLLDLVPGISGKKLHTILRATAEGTQKAYTEQGLPFVTITLPRRTEHALGELLMLHMASVAILANLLRVNAFDQPAVEAYKTHTRAILAKNC
jgi:glucose-6-phosphate isomerase